MNRWRCCAAAATSYYNADGLGSVTSLSEWCRRARAERTRSIRSERQTASSGSLANPFQYTGRELDSETGLYYYRARYYDSGIGRFLGEDPYGFGGGINFYSYVGNEPTGYLDPFGEIRYNKPPPATVPVTGQTLAALQCLEHCLQCVTNNANLDLLVTGGAEQSGHTAHSYHYIGQAVDISFYNPVTTNQVFQCGESCGFTAGQAEPALHHWHLQLTPGNGAKILPALLPMKPCGPTGCQQK